MGCCTFLDHVLAADCLYHTELPTCMPCKHRLLPTADMLTPSIF